MLTQLISTKQLSADGFTWKLHSQRVATITNELRYFAPVAYFQFPSWDSAHDFWKSITDKRLCTRAQVRQAERFTTGYEVKTWGMSALTLHKLVERDSEALPPKGDRSRVLPLPAVRRDWPLAESYSAIAYEAAA